MTKKNLLDCFLAPALINSIQNIGQTKQFLNISNMITTHGRSIFVPEQRTPSKSFEAPGPGIKILRNRL